MAAACTGSEAGSSECNWLSLSFFYYCCCHLSLSPTLIVLPCEVGRAMCYSMPISQMKKWRWLTEVSDLHSHTEC